MFFRRKPYFIQSFSAYKNDLQLKKIVNLHYSEAGKSDDLRLSIADEFGVGCESFRKIFPPPVIFTLLLSLLRKTHVFTSKKQTS